mmetsp:Transcript_3443/g.9009  ORF Transcript_3443/g.9009 Transcript_3443/m.9009 type:complete len:209 (-) Transcript_3443:37-663(-)
MMWFALSDVADADGRRRACTEARVISDLDEVLRVPFSMHSPLPASRELVQALNPLAMEPMVVDKPCQPLERVSACLRLGRSHEEANVDSRASVQGANCQISSSAPSLKKGASPSWKTAIKRGRTVFGALETLSALNSTQPQLPSQQPPTEDESARNWTVTTDTGLRDTRRDDARSADTGQKRPASAQHQPLQPRDACLRPKQARELSQ